MASRPSILLAIATMVAAFPAPGQALFAQDDAISGDAGAGHDTYARACSSCHGPRLEGSPFAPALVGTAFQQRWRGRPAADLLAQMRATMPPRGAGTVAPELFPGLLAFLVRSNVEGPPVQAAAAAPAPTRVGAPRPAAGSRPPSAKDRRRLAALPPVTEALLAQPPDAAWLMWRRTFDSAGHSPLRQIDRGNVRALREAWRLRLDASTNEITPLVHEGVLFVHSGSSVTAVDAVTGRTLWRHVRQTAGAATARAGTDAGRRARVKSMAIHGRALYVPTPDGHLLALDVQSGRPLWERAIRADADSGLQLSSGPLVARGMVIIGASLGLSHPGGCFIVALDAVTGEERWRFHTVARPGTPGGDTWNGAPVEERFGGGVWTTGSYDPQLDLVYFGVGNTYDTATLLQPRPGAERVTANDALYTDATIALRPLTGELAWHHQHHRRDVWDQDWAFEQTLLTLGQGATATRAVVTSGKTGIFEAVDAATGRFLFAHDTGLTNLFTAIDAATGAKRANPALEPEPGRTLLLCPSNFGARNWPATALDPGTGTLFVPMLESCADFTWQPRSRDETASGGTDIRFAPRPRPDGDGNLGRLLALDLATRQVKWTVRQRVPLASSLLATAGGLVFMGDLARQFSAWDQDSGQLLWRTSLPASAESTPIAYAVDGRQYIAVVSGEGSHLGLNNRRLAPELPAPVNELTLVVFALPRR